MSNAETPPGKIETIASGHSFDGTNALMSDEPHTSTATNAPKPHANAISMPRCFFRGIRFDAASSGFTFSAVLRATPAAVTATTGARQRHIAICRQEIAIPIG